MRFIIFFGILSLALGFDESSINDIASSMIEIRNYSTFIPFFSVKSTWEDLDLLSYGVRLTLDTIILPIHAAQIYQNSINFKSIIDLEVPLNYHSNRQLKQFSGGSFILKINQKDSFSTVLLLKSQTLKLSRYPICHHEKTLITVFETFKDDKGFSAILNDGKVLKAIEFGSIVETNCEKHYPEFDSKTQACARTRNENVETPGTPLIAFYDNKSYLVGLSNPMSNENSTLYDFVIDYCDTFPNHQRCNGNYDYNSAKALSKFALCNAKRICDSLESSKKEGILVFGSIQGGDKDSFIPYGLGTIVSDNQVILHLNVLDSQNDYEIYGNGQPITLAYMLKSEVHTFSAHETETLGDRNLKLLKLQNDAFQNETKAAFSFETFKDENIKTFEVTDDQILFIKNRTKEIKDKKQENVYEKFLSGSPIFNGGAVIGFKDGKNFIFVKEFEEKLNAKIENLTIEIPPTTSTTVIPSTTITKKASITTSAMELIKTTPNPMLKKNKTSASMTTTPSNSASNDFVTFWLLLFFFAFVIIF